MVAELSSFRKKLRNEGDTQLSHPIRWLAGSIGRGFKESMEQLVSWDEDAV